MCVSRKEKKSAPLEATRLGANRASCLPLLGKAEWPTVQKRQALLAPTPAPE